MSVAKVTLRFDVFPEEKERLETICKAFGGISKIDFLRGSMAFAEKEMDETRDKLLGTMIQMYGDNKQTREIHLKFKDLPKPVLTFNKEKFIKQFTDRIQKEGEK